MLDKSPVSGPGRGPPSCNSCTQFFVSRLPSTMWKSTYPEGPFPMAQPVKNLPAKAGDARDADLIPGWERSAGERNGYPLQCPGLENPTDRGAWQATVHGVTKSWTQLSMYTHTHTYPEALPLEADLAPTDTWQNLDTSLVAPPGGRSYGREWVGSRDAAKYPQHMGKFPQPELSSPKYPQCRGWGTQP